MFWIKNKKNRYTNCKTQFSYIKEGFNGVYIARTCFLDEMSLVDDADSNFDDMAFSSHAIVIFSYPGSKVKIFSINSVAWNTPTGTNDISFSKCLLFKRISVD